MCPTNLGCYMRETPEAGEAGTSSVALQRSMGSPSCGLLNTYPALCSGEPTRSASSPRPAALRKLRQGRHARAGRAGMPKAGL